MNPFQNKPLFLLVCRIGLLKTLWKKEKLLLTSKVPFSHSVFYPFGEVSAIFITFKIVICKLFHFRTVENLLGMGESPYQNCFCFVVSTDQDQTSQNMQSDLRSTLFYHTVPIFDTLKIHTCGKH